MSGILSAAIAGGATLAASGINAASVGKTNKKTRKFISQQYDKQVQDNIRLWQMQNEYNSPQAQMQRLTDAGLNPNLVYGNGATTEAGAISKGEMKQWNPEAPQFDIGGAAMNAIQSYNSFEMKQAQVDNAKAQNDILRQEALLKAADTARSLMTTAKTEFDLNVAKDMRDTSLQIQQEQLRKIRADVEFTVSENERKSAMNASNLAEAAERILKIRQETANSEVQQELISAQISNIRNDVRLKDLDIQLKKNGVNPNDPIYWRILGRLIGSIDFNMSDLLPKLFKK